MKEGIYVVIVGRLQIDSNIIFLRILLLIMRLYFKFQHFNSVHVVIFFKLEELRTFVADFLHD